MSLLSNILSYSDIPASEKYVLSRDIHPLQSLNPNQLVKKFESYAITYSDAAKKRDINTASKALGDAKNLIKYICSINLQRRDKDMIYIDMYRIAAFHSMYAVYPLFWNTCGLNPSHEKVNYPDGTYVAALYDRNKNVFQAQEFVNALERKYSHLGRDTLRGAAGKMMDAKPNE